MELKDLNKDEDLALLGLMREVVQADGEYSDEERAEVDKLRAQLGTERFDAAVAAAKEQFPSRKELKDHVKGIERLEAQTAILDWLIRVAASDGIDEEETKPLSWLVSYWPKALKVEKEDG